MKVRVRLSSAGFQCEGFPWGRPLWKGFVPLPTSGNVIFWQREAPNHPPPCPPKCGGSPEGAEPQPCPGPVGEPGPSCHIYIPLPVYRDIIGITIWVIYIYIGFTVVPKDTFIDVVCTHGYVRYTAHMKCTRAHIIYII